jgi:hypothetical protein
LTAFDAVFAISFTVFMAVLMAAVTGFVAVLAFGNSIEGKEGIGTTPVLKKERMPYRTKITTAAIIMPGANNLRLSCHVLCRYSSQNMFRCCVVATYRRIAAIITIMRGLNLGIKRITTRMARIDINMDGRNNCMLSLPFSYYLSHPLIQVSMR